MQDRFKFRVWDKEQNKYLPMDSRGEIIDFWISLDTTGVYLVERDNNRNVAFFNDITEDVVVQQCTGLKDKNGRLIYEGDIVKIFHVSSTGQGNLSKRYVAYDEDKARCIFCGEDFMSYITVDTDDIFEVIGNIYENPELFEVKNDWRKNNYRRC